MQPASAQSLPAPPTPDQNLGLNINQSYHGEHEDVNLATGNVHIQLDLLDLPGRNGHDLHMPLEYNTQVWRMFPNVQTVVNSLQQVGTETFWHWTRGSETALPMPAGWYGLGTQPTVVNDTNVQVDQDTTGTGGTVHQFCDTNYRLLMPDGSIHYFPGIKTNCYWDQVVGHHVIYTNLLVGDTDFRDPLWMRYDVNNGLFTANGDRWAGGNFEDTNGNLISFTSNSTPITYTDTVGRTFQLTYQTGFLYPTAVVYKDSNGATQTITLNYLANGTLQTTGSFSNPPPVASTGQPNTYAMAAMTCSTSTPCSWGPMLSSIVLPNGLTYTFHYNSTFGELDQITYPSGGYTRFEYATFQRGIRGDMNGPETPMGPWDYREVVAKHACRAAVVPRGTLTYTAPGAVPGNTCPVPEDTTTYSPSINVYNVNNASNTVTDPLGNVTVAQFCVGSQTSPCDDFPYESKRQVYDNAGHLLRTIDTTYTGVAFFKTSETVTLENGLVSRTEWDYQTAQRLYSQPGPPGVAQVPLTVTSPTGNVTETREFVYGQGGPGPLVRKTDTVWGYGTPGAAFNNRKTSDIVYDSTANTCQGLAQPCGQTQYEYDNYTQGLAASGAIQHDSAFGTGYLTRGNATAINRWRNTDNALLTTRYQYDDAGNRLSATDPLGNPTLFDYTDAWASFTGSTGGNACAPSTGQAKAYLTKVTDALGHATTHTYYSCTGQHGSTTDPNNQTTTFLYDSEGRQVAANYPDGGRTSYDYHGDTLPLTATKTVLATPDPSVLTSTVVDGLGRVSQTRLDSAPGGPDLIDTTYDALGRVATVSNPHTSAVSSTDGTTQWQYDALSRVTQITKQDGSISSAAYSGACTTTTDEAGNQRKGCSDALGRLTEVDEPGGAKPATQASGSLTINGTLQSKPATSATPGTGSVTFSGSEQSKQVQTQAATSATGTVTISGQEQSFQQCYFAYGRNHCYTVRDSGSVSITVNGFSKSVTYGAASTTTTIASALASAFSSDASSPVNASASGAAVTLTAKAAGAATNYSLSATSATNDPADFTVSFTAGTSGPSLTGGQDATFTTVYDAGTCTVTISGTPYSKGFGQGDTTSTIASGLASVIGGGSLVSATASSGTITLTAKSSGAATNYSLSASCSYDSADFPGPSFTGSASGSSLTGGANGSPAATDAGTVQLSVGGYSATVNYGNGAGQDSSTSAIASDLVTQIQGQLPSSNPPFAISANGSSINITWTPGAAGNSVSAVTTSTTTQTAYFSKPSFAACTITANPQSCTTPLSGGADAVPASLNVPLVTLYVYDTLGNLTCVEQHGDAASGTGCSASPSSDATSPWRVRRFTYDSLSRLLTSSNPEANTAVVNGAPTRVNSTYSYDADGNLQQKTLLQANQTGSATTTVSYCYDPVNRPLAKAYTNSPVAPPTCAATVPYLPNPAVTYNYDSGTNGIGRLTHLADQAGSSSYGYDPVGRLKAETRTIAGITKSMSYGYNLDGALNQLIYPSTRVVNYTFDAGAHPLTAIDGNGTQYTSNATYYPSGQEYQRFMPTIYFRTDLNKRLQVAGFYSDNGKVTGYYMSKTYTYNDGHNNGDVMSIINNNDNTRTQTFAYDPLKRLISAQNAGTNCGAKLPDGNLKFWGNTYLYDAWGNLTDKTKISSACSGENLHGTADTQNRVHPVSGADYGYDAAGNMTKDNLGQSYTYDQENRVTGAPGFVYAYDGHGNRVEKATTTTPPTGTLYWYMVAGIVAESDLAGVLQSEYVFFGGERVARVDLPGNAVHYYLSDHLKSTSMVVSAAGIVEDESEYFPWGGELEYANTLPNHYKFTGKERDAETQLDYFGARYYSSSLGRFVSVDVGAAHPANPQSWNRYIYASDNPLLYLDPDGNDYIVPIYTIGRLNVDFWRKEGEFDTGTLLPGLGRFEVQPRKNPKTGRFQKGFNTEEAPHNEGACVLMCVYNYHPRRKAYNLKIWFSYSGRNGEGPISGVNVMLEETEPLPVMGEAGRQEFTFFPGGFGYEPDVHLDINPSALADLTEPELTALSNWAATPNTRDTMATRRIKLDILMAVGQALLQKEKQKEKNKKKDCKADIYRKKRGNVNCNIK